MPGSNSAKTNDRFIDYLIQSRIESYPKLKSGLTPQEIYDLLEEKEVISFKSKPGWMIKSKQIREYLEKNLKVDDCERMTKIISAQIAFNKIDDFSFVMLASAEARIFLRDLVNTVKNYLEFMGVFCLNQNGKKEIIEDEDEKDNIAQKVVALGILERLMDKNIVNIEDSYLVLAP